MDVEPFRRHSWVLGNLGADICLIATLVCLNKTSAFWIWRQQTTCHPVQRQVANLKNFVASAIHHCKWAGWRLCLLYKFVSWVYKRSLKKNKKKLVDFHSQHSQRPDASGAPGCEATQSDSVWPGGSAKTEGVDTWGKEVLCCLNMFCQKMLGEYHTIPYNTHSDSKQMVLEVLPRAPESKASKAKEPSATSPRSPAVCIPAISTDCYSVSLFDSPGDIVSFEAITGHHFDMDSFDVWRALQVIHVHTMEAECYFVWKAAAARSLERKAKTPPVGSLVRANKIAFPQKAFQETTFKPEQLLLAKNPSCFIDSCSLFIINQFISWMIDLFDYNK